MRNIVWKTTALITVILLSSPSAFTQELSGSFNINNGTSTNIEEGEVTSETDTFNRNLYLNFQHSFTPMFTSQINLRTNFADTDAIDSDGEITTAYKRSLEPALDLNFTNPMYDLNAGYRRREQWTTAHLSNESRMTTEFYYSSFDITPKALPSLSIQFDEQRNFDHLSVKGVDTSDTSYSVISGYDLPSRDLKLRYTINYSYNINRSPLSLAYKSINDTFSGNYTLGYSGRFRAGKANYSVSYKGNYSRDKNRQFVSQTGAVLNERTPLGGLYAKSTNAGQKNVDVLLSEGGLIDKDFNTSAGIDLSAAGVFNNIGVMVSSGRSVDRLFIYVNKDIGAEAALNDLNNWNVFKSNFNQTGTWSQVTIRSVSIVFDTLNNVYRYEIEFSDSQNTSFFKAVNLQASDVSGVFVTEIEAYGTDTPDDDILTTVSTSFAQGLNFNASVKPLTKLSFTFHYSLNRTDQNPVSIMNSLNGIVGNIFSDSVSDEKENFSSNIARNYGISSTWLTHRLLTTTFRVQRSEAFDNKDETDSASNTYNVSFNTAPLPTLDANLSLTKSDSYSFNEKNSTNYSLLLSVGSKLYRDVNMVTDLGYTKSKSFASGATSTSRQLNGSIDAVITRRMSGALNYGFSWTDSDGSSSRSREGSTVITYRPGRFINITGNLKVSDSNGDLTASEGISMGWLPLRAIRLNINYQHSDSRPDTVKTDTLGTYAIWYITKFADVRSTYAYTQRKEDNETESYRFNTNLNCR